MAVVDGGVSVEFAAEGVPFTHAAVKSGAGDAGLSDMESENEAISSAVGVSGTPSEIASLHRSTTGSAQEVDERGPRRLWLVRVPKPPELTALAALEQELAVYTQQVRLLNESASVRKVARDDARMETQAARDAYRACRDAHAAKAAEVAPLRETVRGAAAGAPGGRRLRESFPDLDVWSTAELDAETAATEHRLQHETLTLAEEKRLVARLRSLAGQRPRVAEYEAAANAAKDPAAAEAAAAARAALGEAESELRALRAERDAQKQVLDGFWEAERSVDAEVEGILAQRRELKALQDAAHARVAAARRAHRERRDAYYASRRFSVSVRAALRGEAPPPAGERGGRVGKDRSRAEDDARVGGEEGEPAVGENDAPAPAADEPAAVRESGSSALERARAACVNQVDRELARLKADAAYRAEYLALMEQRHGRRVGAWGTVDESGAVQSGEARPGSALPEAGILSREDVKERAQSAIAGVLEAARRRAARTVVGDGSVAGECVDDNVVAAVPASTPAAAAPAKANKDVSPGAPARRPTTPALQPVGRGAPPSVPSSSDGEHHGATFELPPTLLARESEASHALGAAAQREAARARQAAAREEAERRRARKADRAARANRRRQVAAVPPVPAATNVVEEKEDVGGDAAPVAVDVLTSKEVDATPLPVVAAPVSAPVTRRVRANPALVKTNAPLGVAKAMVGPAAARRPVAAKKPLLKTLKATYREHELAIGLAVVAAALLLLMVLGLSTA